MVFLVVKLLLVFTSFLPPQLMVNWASGGHDAVKVSVDGYDPALEQCAKGGLDVRYRYEMRICRKRSAWFDSCSSRYYQIRTMQFDPISEIYSISSDILGDDVPPKVTKLSSFSSAMRQMGEIPALELERLDEKGFLKNQAGRTYLRVQLLADCRGAHSHLAERFSNVLSLGLVRSSGFDSGWIDFELGNKEGR